MTHSHTPITDEVRDALLARFLSQPDNALVDTPQVAGYLGWSIAKLERDRWARQGLPFVRLVQRPLQIFSYV